MRNNVWVRALILAAFSIILGIRAYAYDDGDFQVWNTDTQEFKINKDLKIAFEEEFRWGNDAREFFYQHYDTGILYNMNKYLSLGGGYRHVLSLQTREWKVENEPFISATLSGELKGFKLDTRSRMEYRHFDYQADSWRFRNKFTVKLPWKFTKLEIQPYLADEIFLDFQNKAFSQLNSMFFLDRMLLSP